jgi:hypothetical protein
MDAKALEALKERSGRALRLTAKVGERSFDLQFPNPFTERRLTLSVIERFGATNASGSQLLRDIVEESILAWRGVTYHDLLGDNDNSELECSPATVKLLLDHNLEILDALIDSVHQWRQGRRKVEEEEIKNSSPGSTGILLSGTGQN